jgi:hypothetical protein
MVNDLNLTNPDFFVSDDRHSLWKELRALIRFIGRSVARELASGR